MKFSKLQNILWKKTPEYLWYRLMGKLSGNALKYTLSSVLSDRKLLNCAQLIDRWERYWRVVGVSGLRISKKDFNFRNKEVFELGCGPLLGWAPMALFLGANRYYYNDPVLHKAVVESEKIKDAYFLPFYNELVSNFGRMCDFPTFYKKIMNDCIPINLESNTPEAIVDLIFSNSVLEHIAQQGFEPLMANLYKILKNNGLFFHSVDFGSHGMGNGGFGMLYARPRENPPMPSLNLLRKSEIEKVLINSGFKFESIIYRQAEVNMENMHHFWKKYQTEDLTSRVVFFIGQKQSTQKCLQKSVVI